MMSVCCDLKGFWGEASLDEAQQALSVSGFHKGTYLIRFSNTDPGITSFIPLFFLFSPHPASHSLTPWSSPSLSIVCDSYPIITSYHPIRLCPCQVSTYLPFVIVISLAHLFLRFIFSYYLGQEREGLQTLPHHS